MLSQLSECLVGVGGSLGMDVASGSPVGDFLPVGPGEYPLDREYLGGLQSCLDAWAEGARQCRLRLRPHRPRVAESGSAGEHHR